MGLFLWLPGVADRQGFPHVPVRLVPVHDAAAVLRVDLHVYWTVWRTSVLDAADPDSCHDAVELGLAHTKAIVLYGEGAIGLVEVEGQALVHIDWTEGTTPDSAQGTPRRLASNSAAAFLSRDGTIAWSS